MYDVDHKPPPQAALDNCNELQPEQGKQANCGTKSRRETSDRYFNEIARVGRFRLIVCKDAIHWIIQKQDTKKTSKSDIKWAAKSHHIERGSLIRAWVRLSKSDIPAAVMRLPEQFSATKRPAP